MSLVKCVCVAFVAVAGRRYTYTVCTTYLPSPKASAAFPVCCSFDFEPNADKWRIRSRPPPRLRHAAAAASQPSSRSECATRAHQRRRDSDAEDAALSQCPTRENSYGSKDPRGPLNPKPTEIPGPDDMADAILSTKSIRASSAGSRGLLRSRRLPGAAAHLVLLIQHKHAAIDGWWRRLEVALALDWLVFLRTGLHLARARSIGRAEASHAPQQR